MADDPRVGTNSTRRRRLALLGVPALVLSLGLAFGAAQSATAEGGMTPCAKNAPNDADKDGLCDADEPTVGTNPNDFDSDDDGYGDGAEVFFTKTDPLDPDCDDDGLKDGEEGRIYHTDPEVADTDGDGLGDGEEVFTHKTDPADADSDGDLYADGTEILAASDPNDPLSMPAREVSPDPQRKPLVTENPATDPLNPIF